ncbi:hypothetical protein VOLCADRAFT_121638 [Volvox carteri f. nagariensis]|uniref:Wax synthase domain-containing protein n=1 Tax=Volvox carteri f. nagariensis TaxID=3068 RepID=D8UFK7_VOLCA|nr:uncharacterized protein VOLCADRAFT_121638 [Volvox carteri f. nagariensis]EFJ41473.1 hypothetical protein VOLCADRAFT_121638 [Volvox carteri f. nagariensis]|eukprot:XP_002957418.1 hypothetical protein VOLCADRAFT_121638 [Volvox carteri f. nagariensis]
MRPPFFDTGISTGLRLLIVGLSYFLLAAWLKYKVAPRPLGITRAIAALPIFVANIFCPWLFNDADELMHRLSTAFVLSWLCNFKVLAFCWGRPPLRDSMTVLQLAAVIMLPLFPKPPDSHLARSPKKGRLHDSAGSGAVLAWRWVAKIALLGSMAYMLLKYGDLMPGVVRHYVYAFGLYSFVGVLMDGPAALAVEALGLQLIPTFDQPWLSSSLADFWGRRWNIPTASLLRTVVYDPVIDGSLVPRAHHALHHSTFAPPPPPPPPPAKQPEQDPSGYRHDLSPSSPREEMPSPPQQQQAHHRNGYITKPQQRHHHHDHHDHHQHHHHHHPNQQQRVSELRRQLGLHATFLVSGVVHEYIAWLVKANDDWGWKWTVFFWIQAPLLTLESLAGRAMRRAGLQLPRPVAIVLTLVVLELLAYDLFFGFVEKDTDLASRVVAAVSSGYNIVQSPLRPVFASLAAGLRL